MDIYSLFENYLSYFFLIFARISGIFASAPIFAARNIPTMAKAALAFIFSYIIAPPILAKATAANVIIPGELLPYILVVANEFFIGVTLGFVAFVVFYAIQMSGAIIDVQVGFGMVNVIDPQFGQTIPIVGNLKYLLALLVFLATNGHHLLLAALFSSFEIAPLAQLSSWADIAGILSAIIKNAYIIAVKIAFPIMASVFLSEVALGILAKTMPQMNVFVIGLPVRIILGIFMLIMALPFYVALLDVLFESMVSDIYRILETLGRA